MVCSQCASVIATGANFCTTCGNPVARSTTPTSLGPTILPSGASPVGDYFSTKAEPSAAEPLIPSQGSQNGPFTSASAQLDLSSLFPLREWMGDRSWWRGPLGLFAGFAAAPFFLLHLTHDDDDMNRAAWGFAVYFALMWSLAMYAIIKPERPPVGLIVRVVLFSAVVSTAVAVFLEERLDPEMSQVLWAVGGVGLPEELAKAAPVVIFMYFSKRQWSPRMFMFIGALSGLTFGASEAVAYSALYEQLGDFLSFSDVASVTVWRLLMDSVFHACFSATAAFFIGVAAWHKDKALLLIAIGIGMSSVLHGTYDRWSGNWFGACLAVVNILLFIGYVRSGDRIAIGVSRTDAPITTIGVATS